MVVIYVFCPCILYNLFQMNLTSCTLLLSIFISTSVHVSGNYAPVIRRTYCICATLVFFTLKQVDSFKNNVVIFKTLNSFKNYEIKSLDIFKNYFFIFKT